MVGEGAVGSLTHPRGFDSRTVSGQSPHAPHPQEQIGAMAVFGARRKIDAPYQVARTEVAVRRPESARGCGGKCFGINHRGAVTQLDQ